MKNEMVIHKKYGKGKVVDVKQNHVKVMFENTGEEKLFLYPESFEKFVAFENEGIQKDVERAIKSIEDKKIVAEQERQQEYQRLEEEKKKEHQEELKMRRKVAKEKK